MNKSFDNVEERNHDEEQSVEDRAFDLTVRKMKSKVYPKQLPKHVSEMSRFTEYGDNRLHMSGTYDKFPFAI